MNTAVRYAKEQDNLIQQSCSPRGNQETRICSDKMPTGTAGNRRHHAR